MNGNWSQQDMTSQLGASTTQASLALTAFWAMVTVGRVLFAAIERWLPARAVYHLLPLVLVATFAPDRSPPRRDAPWLGVAVFGLAGLGCSALLPLTISFGQDALTTMSAAVAGGVIAFYQVGYGIAAFGVGPLVDHGTSLSTLYGWTAEPPPRWPCSPSRSRDGQPSAGTPHATPTATHSSRSTEASHETNGAGGPSVGRPVRHRPRDSEARSPRSAPLCAAMPSTGSDVVDGFGIDERSTDGRGQVLAPWPNRLTDGRYQYGGRDCRGAAKRAKPPRRDPRISALAGLVAGRA